MSRVQAWLGARTPSRTSAVGAIGALSLAVAAKMAYASATPVDLRWVLGPSCAVAAWLGHLRFVWDPAEGFVCHGAHMVIGPPCAGVNFLVACALSLYFTTERVTPGAGGKLALCTVSFAGAYFATVCANGARIAAAARFGHADVLAKMADPATIHRSIGVAVYAVALLAVCAAASRAPALGEHRDARAARRMAVPAVCYVAVAVVLPLCHRGLGHGAPVAAHVTQTALAFTAVAAVAWVVGRAGDRLLSRRAQSAG